MPVSDVLPIISKLIGDLLSSIDIAFEKLSDTSYTLPIKPSAFTTIESFFTPSLEPADIVKDL